MNEIEMVKKLRLEVDKFINSTGRLNSSREVSLTHTNLQRSKSWLGMTLGELGSETPYPKSTDASSDVIEPQAEHGVTTIWDSADDLIENTQTAHVKYFRQEIGIYMKELDDFINISASDPDDERPKWITAYLYESRMAMIEAKHWLGWELDRIRKEKKWKHLGWPTTPGAPPLPL